MPLVGTEDYWACRTQGTTLRVEPWAVLCNAFSVKTADTRLPLHDLDLLVGRAVEFVDELIDLPLGGVDLGLLDARDPLALFAGEFYKLREPSHCGVRLTTPEETWDRGGHVTFALALRQRGIIVDHRPTELGRFAPAPLYTSFQDCDSAIATLEEILRTEAHLQIGASHALVT